MVCYTGFQHSPISQPSNTTFGSPPLAKNGKKDGGPKLSTGAIIAFPVSVVNAAAILALALLCRRLHRTKRGADDKKPEVTTPWFFLNSIWRRRPAKAPAELDSKDGIFDDTTEHGSSTKDSGNISAYERVRRKPERQQIAAAQAQRDLNACSSGKTENDAGQVAHYQPPSHEIPDLESPLAIPVGADSAGSLTMSKGIPSPTSPDHESSSIYPMNAHPPAHACINSSNVAYADSEPGIPTDDGRYVPGSRTEARVQNILAPWGSRRLDGEDFVHVPQPAQNRVSWEEDRTIGTD
ncbi:hypothetical protein BJ878DRAFT_477151 [Calycina marina]|uniref:Uncharacterized protein n=1 Tax=Calycina marina TaxID=1763456 RepID=A0A9P8CHW8_9HELO|nr:hypothetical protein BJ878DRAFT_477151 [Calycina marina]